MLNKILKLGISKREAEELLKVSKNIDKDYQQLLLGYPIQYLIGYVNFYGNKIIVNKNVLIPRYETEYLVEKTITYIKKVFNRKVKILDLCSGSGAIGITIKKELDCDVVISDISNEALKIANENCNVNNVDIKIIQSDLLNNISEQFDIIISNPPYINKNMKIMKTVYDYEPHLALIAEEEGLYYYRNIFEQIKKNLNKKYILAFEIGFEQKDKLNILAKEHFNDCKIIFEKDLNEKYRYLFIINE